MLKSSIKKILILLFFLLLGIGLSYFLQNKESLIQNNIFSKIFQKEVVNNKLQGEKTIIREVVQEENAVITAIEKAKPAVVSIITTSIAIDPFKGFFEEDGGIGTGFLVEGGYVFTNKHVVERNELEYKILLNDGKTSFKVVEINTDPVNDFAILKIENTSNVSLPFLKLGQSTKLRVGQTVIAIGNALGEFQNTASKGIISGIGRTIYAGNQFGSSGEYLDNIIQTDAALNNGNSGGPLLDLAGEVIGINVARAGEGDNVGFSIPIDSLKPVYVGFVKTGKIERPFLGIEYYLNTNENSALNRVPVGAVVTKVVANTPAQKAGIMQFDVILEIDDEKVSEENPLSRIIVNKQVGSEVKLKIDRSGKIIEIKVKLESVT